MRIALDALAFLFPVPCAGCGADGRAVCASCATRLAPDLRRLDLAGVGPVTAGFAYDGVARSAILALKEQGRAGLAAPLAPALAGAVTAGLTTHPDARVVAIPSSRSARRRRGYEPVRMLAARAGIRLTPAFLPARAHGPQKTLGVDARAANLDGVFELARPVGGSRVLLLDDVVTTGATLTAAAAVLRAAGAEVVGAAVLAATPRRDGRSSGTLSNPS